MRIISSIREQPKLIPLGRDAVKDLNGIVSAGFSFTIHRNKGMCCSVPVIKFMIVLLFEMPMWICQAYFMRRMSHSFGATPAGTWPCKLSFLINLPLFWYIDWFISGSKKYTLLPFVNVAIPFLFAPVHYVHTGLKCLEK